LPNTGTGTTKASDLALAVDYARITSASIVLYCIVFTGDTLPTNQKCQYTEGT